MALQHIMANNGSTLNYMVSSHKLGKTTNSGVLTIYVHTVAEAELEAKVRRIAQVEVLKTQLDLKKELDQRTQNMRDFVSTQVKHSQVSIEGLKDDMKFQASMTNS